MLAYLQVCRAKGRDYGYYRRAGVRVRVPGEVGSAAFLAAYQELHATAEAKLPAVIRRPDVLPGSFRALWIAYKSSGEWRILGTRTKGEYARLIEPLLTRWGNKPVKALPAEWVVNRRDEMAITPSKANHFLSVIRLLLNWSIPRGWLKHNPAAQVKPLRHKATSHRVWTDREVEVMTGQGAEAVALPVLLALYTGQRLGDVLVMPWGAYDGRRIIVVQSKTGVRLSIPAHHNLRAVLDSEPRRAVVMCTRPDSAAWKIDHFKHRFAAIRQAVSLPADLHFHGLRHSAGTRLAEAGCTPHEIAAILGHKTLVMISRYTQGVQQEALATTAIRRLEKQKPNRVVKRQKPAV